MRRRLRERAIAAGVRLEPIVEVESTEAALDLVVRGVGDTIATIALIRDLGLADRLSCVSLEPPLHERYALITPRGAPTSPAIRALVAIVGEHLALDVEPSQP
jgi:DNA-binding transcriptional LysR family regulator